MAKNDNFNYYPKPVVFSGVRTSFSHLRDPDTAFGKTEYSIMFYPDPDDPILEDLLNFLNENRPENQQETKIPSLKKDKEGTGFTLKATSKDPSKFMVVDNNKQPTQDDPWRGSIVNIVAQPVYTKVNGGVSLWLQAVQIVENAKDSGGQSPTAALALLDGDTVEAALSEESSGKSAEQLLAELD